MKYIISDDNINVDDTPPIDVEQNNNNNNKNNKSKEEIIDTMTANNWQNVIKLQGNEKTRLKSNPDAWSPKFVAKIELMKCFTKTHA